MEMHLRGMNTFNAHSLVGLLVFVLLCTGKAAARTCRGRACTRGSIKLTTIEAEAPSGSLSPSPSPTPGRHLDCCACGQAVYNITFIGKWSNSTLPRHFPGRMARWSPLIGCTHNKRYVMWQYGGQASPGVRKVSEWGSTKLLEKEMKQQRGKVLSIAKTRGLWKGMGATSAELKANTTNNLVSIITRMIPSPDWSVGVDRLNLCNLNCTWKKTMVEELYPWDAGTDDGITFTSVNTKSNPQGTIQRLIGDLHNHTSASFHRKPGDIIHPVAQLHITLQRVDSACDQSDSRFPYPPKAPRVDCAVSRWSRWTECSVSCGMGKQSRGRAVVRKPTNDGIKCPHMRERRKCFRGKCNEPIAVSSPSVDCKVSPWSLWSRCAGLCGRGSRSRTRVVLQKPQENGRRCPVLLRWRKCKLPKCSLYTFLGNCVLSEWTPWTQCTKTCNRGKMFRHRKIMMQKDSKNCHEKIREKKRCNTHKCHVGKAWQR